MSDEALAILRELVEPNDAGLDITDGGAWCFYCEVSAELVGTEPRPAYWKAVHAPVCPIRRARELLASYVERSS